MAPGHKQVRQDAIVPPAPAPAPITQQQSATALTPDQALATINAVIAQDAFILQTLAWMIGLAAIVGVGTLIFYVRSISKRLAKAGVNAYLSSGEHTENIRKVVIEELQTRTAVLVHPVNQGEAPSQFPQAPRKGGE